MKDMDDNQFQHEKFEFSKPADRCEKEWCIEMYFGYSPDEVNEKTPIITDFGHLVNLLYMFAEDKTYSPAKLKDAFLTLMDCVVEANEAMGVKPEVIDQIKKLHMNNAGL